MMTCARPRRLAAAELRLETGDIDELATVFAPPRWLEDIGRSSWLFVGAFALLAGVMWFLAATYTIVGPVVVGTVIATVTMPLVSGMQRHRIPRVAGAGIVLLGIVAIAVAVRDPRPGRDQGSELRDQRRSEQRREQGAELAGERRGQLVERGRRELERVERSPEGTACAARRGSSAGSRA